MVRLSSDWTLFYKIFLPTVWISFFGVVMVVLIVSFKPGILLLSGALVFYLGGILLLYLTLLRLKRVEGSNEHLYVTNYFKTFRYTFDSIGKIRAMDMFIFKVVQLHFKEKTSFGRRVYFLRRRGVWEEYLAAYPALSALRTAVFSELSA